MNYLSAIFSPSVLIHAILWPLGFIILFRIQLLEEENLSTKTSTDENTPLKPLSVSVIIPARNEAKTLPALLSSLQLQTYLPHEVIVVDDHSTDATGRIARELGARVINIPALPEGWKGKPWACHHGSHSATGELFIFLDADTFLTPQGLSRIVQTYGSLGGVLSIQPYHEVKYVYENLSAIFNLIQTAASNAFTVLGDVVSEKRVFGPALVLNSEHYFQAGGHESVRNEIVENYVLSKNFINKGIPIHCFSGLGALSYRMYPNGVRGLIDGWTKSMAAGAHGAALWIMLGIIGWLMGALGTFRHLMIDIVFGNGNHLPWLTLIFICYSLQLRRFLRPLGSFSPWISILYPLPVSFFAIVFVRSLFYKLIQKPIQWKGRPVSS